MKDKDVSHDTQKASFPPTLKKCHPPLHPCPLTLLSSFQRWRACAHPQSVTYTYLLHSLILIHQTLI